MSASEPTPGARVLVATGAGIVAVSGVAHAQPDRWTLDQALPIAELRRRDVVAQAAAASRRPAAVSFAEARRRERDVGRLTDAVWARASAATSEARLRRALGRLR